jgi:Mce-associated membrane protein
MPDPSESTAESAVAPAQTIAVDDEAPVSESDSDEEGVVLQSDSYESDPEALDSEVDDDVTADETRPEEPTGRWRRVLVYGVLPALALLLALGAGYLKWQRDVASQSILARTQSVQAATESTIAMLSYKPDTVEKDLGAARDRLTGQFRDSYSSLVREVVIPGALRRRISAVATVPAAASVSATENRAVVLVFVDQTTTIGNDPPTDTASSVKVTLDKVGSRWLISDFTPV